MSNQARKNLQILLLAISMILLFVFTGSLNNINFSEGSQLDLSSELITPTGTKLPPQQVELLAKILGYLLVFSFLISIVMLFISEEARKRFLRWIIIGIILSIIVAMPRSPSTSTVESIPEETPESLSSVGTGESQEEFELETVSEPPNWIINILSVVISLGLIAVAVAVYFSRKQPKPLEVVAEEAQKAMDAIQTGEDFRNVIIRCYHQMSQAIAEHQNITRGIDITPREFEKTLIEIGFPQIEVNKLTSLFEKVRYGSKTVSQDEEIIAMASLKAIVNHKI